MQKKGKNGKDFNTTFYTKVNQSSSMNNNTVLLGQSPANIDHHNKVL